MSATINIHLINFQLPPQLVKPNDEIRISVTSVPENHKQAFVIRGRDMNSVHKFFTLDITNSTKKIIFVFRKKNFFTGDPIIASTIVHSNDFPQVSSHQKVFDANGKTLTFPIFEPIQGNTYYGSTKNRRIIGQMVISLNIEGVFPEIYSNDQEKSYNQNQYGYENQSMNTQNNEQYTKPQMTQQFNNQSMNQQYGNQPMNQQYGNQPMNQQYGNQPMNQQYGNQPMAQQFSNQQMNQQYGNQPMNQQFNNKQMNQQYGNPQMNQQYGNQSMNQQFNNQQMNQQFNNQSMNQQYGNQSMNQQQYGNQQMNQQYGNPQMNQQYGNQSMNQQQYGNQQMFQQSNQAPQSDLLIDF